MDKLMKMIEACARSEYKVRLIQESFNSGKITSGECIDKIVEETERIKKELQKIRLDKKQFWMDRKVEAYEYN